MTGNDGADPALSSLGVVNAVTTGELDLLAPDAMLERVYTGSIWGEGPVWLPSVSRVRWSDIPNNRILEFDPATGATNVHRDAVEFTNGRTLDRAGVVLQCSHGRRAVEAEVDGVPRTLVDSFAGVRLNSPNDIVVASDGSIWFTDPDYGITQPREGHPGVREYGGAFVFRFVPETGELTAVVTDRDQPNGLAFSPDESLLYVSDTVSPQVARIWVYDVSVADGTAHGCREFAHPSFGVSDGFRVDVAGRVWTSAGSGVQVFAPDGGLLLSIVVPEPVANVCFGGVDGHDLYITASTGLYRIRTATTAGAGALLD